MRKRSIVFTIVVLCLMGIAIIFISQNEEESISDPMNENVEVLNNQEDEDNTRLENNQDEDDLLSSESEMDDYNTRRLEPVENEILMDQMGYGNIETDKNILPQYVLDELENQLVSVFYDTNQEMDIWMYVKDSSLPASIWIQGKEDASKKLQHSRDIVFGLLDCSLAMYFFLPFFGQKLDGVIQEVSLISLTEYPIYLKIPYVIIVSLIVLCGIATLAFQNCSLLFWCKNKAKLSLSLSVGGTAIFMISLQPYAAMFTFIFLLIKTLMLIKWA